MTGAFRKLRRVILGETWTIPAGVVGAIALACLIRTWVPHSEWQPIGGFALAAALITTLMASLRRERNQHRPKVSRTHQSNVRNDE